MKKVWNERGVDHKREGRKKEGEVASVRLCFGAGQVIDYEHEYEIRITAVCGGVCGSLLNRCC